MLFSKNEFMPRYLRPGSKVEKGCCFGSEYSVHPKWGLMERLYVRLFGVVDLPSRLRARIVFREVRKLGGNIFLDLGSGTGTYSFYLAREPSRQVWGVDTNASRIEGCGLIAQQLHLDNAHFLAGSGHEGLCGFQSNSFDGALAIEVIECLPDVTLALKEIFRLLKPGGYLIGHVPVIGHLREHEKWLLDDANLPGLLTDAGFEIASYVPTFGRSVQSICRVFGWAARSRLLVSLTFPVLLLFSFLFRIESPDGQHRLFVARKPLA